MNICIGKFHRTFYPLVLRGFSGRSHSAPRLRQRTQTHLRQIIISAQAPIQEVHVSRKHLTATYVQRVVCYCSRGVLEVPASTHALVRHWQTKWRPRALPRSCRAGRTPRTTTSSKRLLVSNHYLSVSLIVYNIVFSYEIHRE